jgi:hypothetical protein
MTRFRAYPTAAAWTAAALVVAGLVAIWLSWRGAAGTASLVLQLPYLVSGAFVGLGLVVCGGALVHIELARRLAAEEQAALRDVIDTAARTVIALRDAAQAPPAPPPRPRSRRRTRT